MNKGSGNKRKDNGIGKVIAALAVFTCFFDSFWVGISAVTVGCIILWAVWTKKKQEETGDSKARMSLNEFWQRLKFEVLDFFANDSDGSDDEDDEDEECDADYGDFAEENDEPAAEKYEATYTEPDDIPQDTGSFSKWVTAAKKAEETEACEADHVHAERYFDMTSDEKRRQQLDSMLENGLIDKKEYKLMLKKYGLK